MDNESTHTYILLSALGATSRHKTHGQTGNKAGWIKVFSTRVEATLGEITKQQQRVTRTTRSVGRRIFTPPHVPKCHATHPIPPFRLSGGYTDRSPAGHQTMAAEDTSRSVHNDRGCIYGIDLDGKICKAGFPAPSLPSLHITRLARGDGAKRS